MPVTTPMAKFSAKMRPKNRVQRARCASLRRKAAVFQIASTRASPIVSCGKM
jgi:hypothetical protein